MRTRQPGLQIVLVLIVLAGTATASTESPVVMLDSNSASAVDDDSSATVAKYKQVQRDLFDALRGDSSPRMQALVGRIDLSDDDAAGPLRPKSEDVVARAARLTPEDPFVQ
jgi:hypothetical protein